MSTVRFEISMSVDGYAAGPDISHAHPLGVGGERLHDWLMTADNADGTEQDREAAQGFWDGVGSFVIGRRTFDLGIALWGDDGTFGRPCFVPTHRPAPRLQKGPTTFEFVAEGIERALELAKAAAGSQAVCIMGGATTIQQYLRLGVIDEMRLHVAHVLLGAGTKLFPERSRLAPNLAVTRMTQSPRATHYVFRIARS